MKTKRYTTDNGNIEIKILNTVEAINKSLLKPSAVELYDFIPTNVVEYKANDIIHTLYLTDENIQIFIETGVWLTLE